MKKSRFWWTAVGVVVTLFGCSSENEPIEETMPVEETPEEVLEESSLFELTEAEKEAANRTLDFQTELFRAVNADSDNGEKNVLVSPVSAQIFASVIANTSGQVLRNEILTALDCEDLDALNSLAAKMLNELPKVDETVSMTFANSIWYNERYTVSDGCAATLNEAFSIVPMPLDFSNGAQASGIINRWTSEKTNSLINNIVGPEDITPALSAVMATAQYFKGGWDQPFDEKDTALEPFKSADNSVSQVEMMKRSKKGHHYHLGEDCKAIKMYFGHGKFYAMFVLPPYRADINEFVKTFDPNAELGFIDMDNVTFWLPKFKLETGKIGLNRPFGVMGISSLMRPEATAFFTDSHDATYDMYQTSMFSVEEKGAEGATAIWTHMNGADLNSDSSFDVLFNRPFLFFVKETSTGACIFAGKIIKL